MRMGVTREFIGRRGGDLGAPPPTILDETLWDTVGDCFANDGPPFHKGSRFCELTLVALSLSPVVSIEGNT